MKLTNKKIYIFPVIIFFILFINFAQAQLSTDVKQEMDMQDQAFTRGAGYDIRSNLGSTLRVVIEGFLGLLGVIFIILIIIAGYNWMTAAGDEQKVTKAKDTIQRAIIGLIIILAAYSITYFVFRYVPFGSGGVGGFG